MRRSALIAVAVLAALTGLAAASAGAQGASVPAAPPQDAASAQDASAQDAAPQDAAPQAASTQGAAAQGATTESAAGWTLGGSLSLLPALTYAGSGSLDAADFTYGSGTTLGLTLKTGGGRARAEGSVEAAVLTGASAVLAQAIAASPYARTDELLLPASPSSASGQDAAMAARIRTLYGKLDFDWASFTLGRQVLNYGRGALWTPTDIFTELDLSGISPVRRGTDALRIVLPLSVTGGLDLAAAPTLFPGSGRYAVRLSGLLDDVDAALMAARDGAAPAWLAGADFKADVIVGLYGDAIYEQPDAGGGGFMRAAAGADYSFGDFIVAAEYYYNGGGAAADLLYPDVHNVFASLTWTASELFALTLSTVVDLQGGAGTGTLLARISAAQNADVTAYLEVAHGNAGYGLAYGLVSAVVEVQAGAGLEVKF